MAEASVDPQSIPTAVPAGPTKLDVVQAVAHLEAAASQVEFAREAPTGVLPLEDAVWIRDQFAMVRLDLAQLIAYLNDLGGASG